MSKSPESELPEFELDRDLQLLPAWAQKPPTENRYAKYEVRDDNRGPRRGDRGDRPERREGRPQRREQGGPGPREPRSSGAGEFRRPQPGRDRPDSRREPAAPSIEIDVTFIPDEKGVESLARQIRLTGRAYPLFQIASLVLKKPDRYHVRLDVNKKPDGQPIQPLFVCDLDETLWLSEQEAINYVLDKHFSTFYQTEKIPTDPPKGTYTFVAQCGMSGTILGPPNYHDYQNKLRKLHAERFSRVPFEAFKARIKIVRDEPIVKKWLDDQSFKTEFICLNMPEQLKLGSRDEVEKHFRETHLPNVIKQVDAFTLSGTATLALPCRPLQNHVRRAWDDQLRFPLKVVTTLSHQFAGHGLQFFKVNKTVTHVAVARPRYLDLEVTPVSEGIKRIVDLIQQTRNCSRRKLLEVLAPGSIQQPAPEGSAGDAQPPSPEVAAIVSDLHWLIHQGHVIEFANGILELARKPVLNPPKPKPVAPSAEKPPAPETTVTASESSSVTEHLSSEPVVEPEAPRPEPSASTASDSVSSSAAETPIAKADLDVQTLPVPEPQRTVDTPATPS